ncbi:hypothetical protein SAMN02745221_01959 [Thermosyntropha lipolytica DSM 11003]|uniref:Uncharacterized protein n=1 Tax=Thermosyntropha lipolytica DSM 11003 TaxID=1123382 RepID=A0A1M5R7A2_9FIRM|nr:hypothetical protein [Thermosyntropha lipolytica]SHH22224.1 hypothetical protein SAMN02745221_01959 [Thermosyntropha lipolytica DSM 11003]
MKWKKLIFKQKQPLHIGALKWGVINETGIFIPGWTMWGALTNLYLRKKFFNNLEQLEDLFASITNFYPLIKTASGDSICLYPAYKDGKFGFIEENDKNKFYDEDKFRFDFVDTLVSTAIVPVNRGAKDESLHEIEFILPKEKSGDKFLYWLGLIGIRDEDIEEVDDFLKKGLCVYAGGEIKYGWGELELLEVDDVDDKELIKWQLNSEGFLDISKADMPLRNFLEITEFKGSFNWAGEIKLLVEFDFTKNIPEVKEAGYFVNVGSVVNLSDKLEDYRLNKGKFCEKHI